MQGNPSFLKFSRGSMRKDPPRSLHNSPPFPTKNSGYAPVRTPYNTLHYISLCGGSCGRGGTTNRGGSSSRFCSASCSSCSSCGISSGSSSNSSNLGKTASELFFFFIVFFFSFLVFSSVFGFLGLRLTLGDFCNTNHK